MDVSEIQHRWKSSSMCFHNHLRVTGSFNSENGSNVLIEYATIAVTTRNKTCVARTTVIPLERLTNGQDKNFGSLPQMIKVFLTSFTNNGVAVASKYDSVEEEEKESGD
ncbi:uncharacterized protein LOC102095319 [Columba livia]|uniref:uncharacterized protein LOC102095319 n=1 Tax=Columba livia TaxID=8932 RepID=UPI0031BAC9A5